MTIYEKNMKELELNKPYIYNRLYNRGHRTNRNKLEHISLIDTRDGSSSISIAYQGQSYRLNSKYNPLLEAEKWAEQFEIRNLDIVAAMFGFGNGFFARELLKRLKENDILIIYEPCSEIFFYILEHFDIIDILHSPKVNIIVEDINDNEFKHMLSNHVNWININSQIICVHPQYDLAFIDSKLKFSKILLDNNNYIMVNQNTNAALSKLITYNTLSNLQYLKECNIATDLIGRIPSDIPAIIVAAGPSLDKNIDELKSVKGRAVIFAVDTAVKYLLAHDIEPDFIVTLDPQKSLHHLADKRCDDIPIFTRIEARAETLKKNNKKIILYNIEGYSKKLLNKLGKDTGILNSGGSVATGAFSICKTLGFEKIILIGLDLAYSGESTHAGGFNVDVAGAGRFLETVDDIYGNKIKTRYDWFIYLKWFEEAIGTLNDAEVIDATEGGAKISGTTILSLEEAIHRYCVKEIDCDTIIRELKPTVSNEEVSVVIDTILNDIEDLSEIRDKAEKGKEICGKLINKYKKTLQETNASNLKNEQLRNINKFIENKDVYELIDWDITADTFEYISELYVYKNDENDNKFFTYLKAKDIYVAISAAVDRISPMLEDALKSFHNL